MRKILITRPKAQGLNFARQTCLDMDDFLFEPLIEIRLIDVTLPDLNIYDGVIITSAHAKDALPESIKCYSVGDYAPTAKELAVRIIRDNPNEMLRLLYIRGADVAFDMKYALSEHKIDELISYEAVAAHALSDELIASFKNGNIGAIAFFSKRTAEIFVKLAQKADILDNMKDIKALCISNSMVECLYSIFGDNIKVSHSPDLQGMLRMINNMKGY